MQTVQTVQLGDLEVESKSKENVYQKTEAIEQRHQRCWTCACAVSSLVPLRSDGDGVWF